MNLGVPDEGAVDGHKENGQIRERIIKICIIRDVK
jgi:hypothetical protein